MDARAAFGILTWARSLSDQTQRLPNISFLMKEPSESSHDLPELLGPMIYSSVLCASCSGKNWMKRPIAAMSSSVKGLFAVAIDARCASFAALIEALFEAARFAASALLRKALS